MEVKGSKGFTESISFPQPVPSTPRRAKVQESQKVMTNNHQGKTLEEEEMTEERKRSGHSPDLFVTTAIVAEENSIIESTESTVSND
jgi:hypothetical protein